MTNTQEHIEKLLAGCERQAEAWEKIQPPFDITEPFRSEKLRILYVSLGYVGRMLELYHDTRLVLEDDRLLSGVLLARASVECAAMMCFLHEQMKTHFLPRPSPDCMRMLERHMYGGRHKTTEAGESINSYHICDAIRKSNEFALGINDSIKNRLNVPSNIEGLVPGATVVDYKIVDELGPFGWIYSVLSELAHPNPLGNRRYFGESAVGDTFSDEALRFVIAEGLSRSVYAGIATDALFAVVGATTSE